MPRKGYKRTSDPSSTIASRRTTSRTTIPPQRSNNRITVTRSQNQKHHPLSAQKLTSPPIPVLARRPHVSPESLSAYPIHASVYKSRKSS
jgi:hypothetical protein